MIAGQKPERDTELHYRNVLFIVFKLVGLYTQVEYHTSNGRIDLVLQTDRYVYIMEFKLNGTAEEALRQIEEKGYALPFAGDGPGSLQDRRELLFRDPQYREVAGWVKKSMFLSRYTYFADTVYILCPEKIYFKWHRSIFLPQKAPQVNN